jgi:hypothetical protein
MRHHYWTSPVGIVDATLDFIGLTSRLDSLSMRNGANPRARIAKVCSSGARRSLRHLDAITGAWLPP